jgi:cardiolipin synthase
VYEAIGQARHHVYVENPYLADARLVYLLAEARARGADVRVVLTVQSDSKLYDHSNRVTANRLLRAGARVYLYPGMTHAKTLAVDGTWAYLGTGNFDDLSLRHNRELGLTLSDGPTVQDLERCLFEPDFDSRYELTTPLPVTPLDYLAELAAEIAG